MKITHYLQKPVSGHYGWEGWSWIVDVVLQRCIVGFCTIPMLSIIATQALNSSTVTGYHTDLSPGALFFGDGS